MSIIALLQIFCNTNFKRKYSRRDGVLVDGLEEIRQKVFGSSSRRRQRSSAPHLIVRISSHKCHINKETTHTGGFFVGGLEEIRTPDPHNANVVRSQLRYEPINYNGNYNENLSVCQMFSFAKIRQHHQMVVLPC